MRRIFVISSIIILSIIGLISLVWQPILWSLLIIIPLIIRGIVDIFQHHHSLLRNYPIVGHARWTMEFIRPYVRQYLFESETDGAPINRMHRSVIYQRAKGSLDSIPYGTKLDTQRVGYEWIGHSLAAKHHCAHDPVTRVTVGGPHCSQPYDASIFNISAMSFGALSNNAIRALNKGAALGGFYHNTGEGSVSDYHLEFGGDLVWQIGTGYFGCRDAKGNFAPEAFQQVATRPSIKMIEIKLSQGAKPGHGGILPAHKNTNEIARIRLVEPNTQVDSPPSHSAFSTPKEMLHFIQQLRELSGGKPVGIKLAIGRTSEFIALCKAMVELNLAPDFITVDGGEGGTGAAPLEFANSIGMPLREALVFVCDVLVGFNLKKQIKVIASGKVFTGFNIVKNIAVGADICNSARGMMVALGCIQSLECHTNKCPTGVATQNPALVRGLVVESKAERVARYHKETVKASMEMIAAAGFRHMSELNRSHIFRRISETEVRRFDQIYNNLLPGGLLNGSAPDKFEQAMRESSAESFMPVQILEETKHGLTAVN